MAEKTLTKEEWAKVEKALGGICGSVKLKIDGHVITLERRLVSKNRLGICVYVDGYMKGKWLGLANDCPEQRYMCPRDSFIYPAKYRAQVKAAKISKKFRKEMGLDDVDKKMTCFHPTFPSGRAVRIYYQKTFKNIELLEDV